MSKTVRERMKDLGLTQHSLSNLVNLEGLKMNQPMLCIIMDEERISKTKSAIERILDRLEKEAEEFTY